jgi:hypothetical protein
MVDGDLEFHAGLVDIVGVEPVSIGVHHAVSADAAKLATLAGASAEVFGQTGRFICIHDDEHIRWASATEARLASAIWFVVRSSTLSAAPSPAWATPASWPPRVKAGFGFQQALAANSPRASDNVERAGPRERSTGMGLSAHRQVDARR